MTLSDDFQTYLNQAYAYEEKGDFPQALQTCDKAIELDPHQAEVHNLRGIILEVLDRPQEAFEAYSTAIQLQPDFKEANQNLAELNRELGETMTLNSSQKEDPAWSEKKEVTLKQVAWAPFTSGIIGARLIALFFGLTILLSLATASLTYSEITMTSEILAGNQVFERDIVTNLETQQTIALPLIGITIAGFITFFWWVYQSYRNLTALGVVGLNYSPGWVVAYFFIPILNLFRPYQAIKEIWQGSDPDVNLTDQASWQWVDTPRLIGFWWLFWILNATFSRVVGRLAGDADTLEAIIVLDWISIASDAISIVASILMIILVKEITELQEEKYKRVKDYVGLRGN